MSVHLLRREEHVLRVCAAREVGTWGETTALEELPPDGETHTGRPDPEWHEQRKTEEASGSESPEEGRPEQGCQTLSAKSQTVNAFGSVDHLCRKDSALSLRHQSHAWAWLLSSKTWLTKTVRGQCGLQPPLGLE